MPRKGNEPARIPECHPERRHLARGMCKQCYDRWLSSQNREKQNARKRAWAKANPDRVRAIRRKYNYGVDDYEIRGRMLAQEGKCKICLTEPATHLDHNHSTGQVRSLLCNACNKALGLFRENRDTLRTAIRYLDLWDTMPHPKPDMRNGAKL